MLEAFDAAAMAIMPEGKVHNYVFKGTKELLFQNKSLVWGFEKEGISNGAAYADFDNDGDLDLVTNNLNEPSVFYENQTNKQQPESGYLRVKLEGYPGNTFALGAKVVIKNAAGMQMQQLASTRGFESSSEPVIHFGVGKERITDSLIIVWPNQHMQVLTQVKANQLLKIKYSADLKPVQPALWIVKRPDPKLFEDVTERFKIPYKHRENQYYDSYRESLIPFLVSTEGPKVAVADVNGDGLEDMYVGGAKWQAGSLFLQRKDGKFVVSPQADINADSTFEDVDAVFFDANKDGFKDLYVVSGGNEFYDKMPEQFDRLYLNDGKGNFKRERSALPPMFDNKSCVKPFDIDNDGDLDLFIGGRVVAFKYGIAPNSYILINDGKGHFTDKTVQLAPGLRNIGMVTDAVWADMDGDKQKDLIVVGDWMPVTVFLNKKGNLKSEQSGKYKAPSGFWQCVTAADFDQDGDMDLVVGNLGANNKFKKQPNSHLKMWVKDFDNNMGLEQVLAYSVDDNWYPVAFKDELGKRIPSIINKRFTDYKSYAGKTIDQLFKTEELKDARLVEVDKFESVYLENKDGGFVVHDLPNEAQVSKIFTWAAADINGDGKLDLLGGGNYLGVSTYQGRYDSSYGLVLINKGKGNFESLSPVETGFLLNGEIRDIKSLKVGADQVWVIARNNLPLTMIKALGVKKPVM
ncbi:FG-GAP-like repeat-containing protein [Dyadobacter sp. NIV53]|uniref:FG-GAP-like repeat-containing protein n=1 Tax=Dyadobacter sp. NIV53 TaxID=2861765 RepID=UPI00286DF98D|nr:FG-GAP-like repeat-containing protein [Dyadobacter sp. NIV53]